jgi:hypothetical protein
MIWRDAPGAGEAWASADRGSPGTPAGAALEIAVGVTPSHPILHTVLVEDASRFARDLLTQERERPRPSGPSEAVAPKVTEGTPKVTPRDRPRAGRDGLRQQERAALLSPLNQVDARTCAARQRTLTRCRWPHRPSRARAGCPPFCVPCPCRFWSTQLMLPWVPLSFGYVHRAGKHSRGRRLWSTPPTFAA